MPERPLRTLLVDFAVHILDLVKILKSRLETIVSNQIVCAGISIGANNHEAQYAHGEPDFISKLQIALKEANETGYWLELLLKTNYIDPARYQELDNACSQIRVGDADQVHQHGKKLEKNENFHFALFIFVSVVHNRRFRLFQTAEN